MVSAMVSSNLTIGRGPAILGRHALVRVGQPSPAEWTHTERVLVDLDRAEAADLAARLHQLTDSRSSCVIELADATDEALDRPFSSSRPPHEISARVKFVRQQLRHLISSNSVDFRNGAVWPLIDQAVRLGAKVE